MRSSRGMGAMMASKMPKGVTKKRRDDTDFTEYKKGGDVKMAGGGLYANINARKKKGISRGKSESTISPKAYANMKAGFPKGKK